MTKSKAHTQTSLTETLDGLESLRKSSEDPIAQTYLFLASETIRGYDRQQCNNRGGVVEYVHRDYSEAAKILSLYERRLSSGSTAIGEMTFITNFVVDDSHDVVDPYLANVSDEHVLKQSEYLNLQKGEN